MAEATMDLFGDTVQAAPAGHQARSSRRPLRASNDMHRMEEVLMVAVSDCGYVLAGVAERVYRLTPAAADHGVRQIEAVPGVDADMVAQLIASGWLTVGGAHVYRWRNRREGRGFAVLVPKRSRDALARWSALRRPITWGMKETQQEGGM